MLVYFAVFERHENKDLSVATPSSPSPCVELRDCFEAVTKLMAKMFQIKDGQKCSFQVTRGDSSLDED